MRTLLTLLAILLFTLTSIAQNGINYKAVIKDDLGNVVANQPIDVLFTILKGPIVIYEETHSPMTNNNGIIITNIGEGTPVSGTFSSINWGSGNHCLNVQIDLGSGLMNFGTKEFMVVPYAKHAEKAANVRGLETLNEGNGFGWRLIGRDVNNYGALGWNAVDFSFSSDPSSVKGATGHFSTALGLRSTASGESSLAMGGESRASGQFSTAIGTNVYALSYAETAFGRYNTDYTPATTNGPGTQNWNPTDRLFGIGNGTITDNGGTVTVLRKDALIILKNGNIGIGKNANIDGKLEIEHNSTLTSPHIYLHEEGSDYARLNFSNTNRAAYWAIAGTMGTTVSGDRLNFFNSSVGDILSIHGTGQVHISGSVYVNGAVVHASDQRLKKDIEPLSYGLKELLKLEPKAYNWKDKESEHKSLGLIAQELELIIKELVIKDSETELLSVNYTELIPVLIKAIQEQQNIIDGQQITIEAQKAKDIVHDISIEALVSRLTLIELKSSN